MNTLPDIIFSVTDLSQTLKEVVETAFARVKVKGEVFGVKRASSGHIYFSLKDENAVLNAICWRGCSPETSKAIEEGLEVIATGKLTTYPGRSNYQMIVSTVEPAGQGALLKLLEERKKKLAAEGLFDAARKKKIPFLPTNIGVVTSPTGAVIRDIMHRLNDRFPVSVYLWPTLVQGDGAAEQIAAAIRGFNALPAQGLDTPDGHIPRPDVLIVARGGGSLEDLWCFNEEIVARAAAESEIPLISAVGHETDTTLIDYVSDLRAPTPTGAAEMAVPVLSELKVKLAGIDGRLLDALYRLLDEKKTRLAASVRGLPNLSEWIEQYVQKLDDRTERLHLALKSFLGRLTDRFQLAARLLEANSYERVLDKGFAFVQDEKGQVISSAASAEAQTRLSLGFKDGKVPVTVDRQPAPSPAAHEPAPSPIPSHKTAQGELF